MTDVSEALKLEDQLCFPLYAASREIIRRYHPVLSRIGLTYTQYITMMVLWDKKEATVKELGRRLYLDSGTLTPVLKELEQKGLVKRERSRDDERVLNVCVTGAGMELRTKAAVVPEAVATCINLEPEESVELYRLLYKLLESGAGDGTAAKDN